MCLDNIINICAKMGIIPAIIVGFIVCTWGFYSIIKDNEMEYTPLVLAFSLGVGMVAWGYIVLLVFTIPFTIFIGSAYFLGKYFATYKISISKINKNEDKTT